MRLLQTAVLALVLILLLTKFFPDLAGQLHSIFSHFLTLLDRALLAAADRIPH